MRRCNGNSAPHREGVVARRSFLYSAATCLAVSAAAVSPFVPRLAASAPQPVKLLSFFDTVALISRNPQGPSRPGWVRKWTGPVAVRLYGKPEPRQLAEVAAVLSRLSSWTGLPFSLAGRYHGGANRIDLHIRSHGEMVERHGKGGPVCETATYGFGGRLHTGAIEVSERFTDCLRHEFMHALGFDNHWTGPYATGDMTSTLAMRGAAARASYFSPCDELAIRILYDRRLPPGMPRDTALPVAEGIVETLLDA